MIAYDFIFRDLQVAGPYLPQYEIYYKKLDPEGKNEIPAMAAAGFLKKSGLTDEQLGKVMRYKVDHTLIFPILLKNILPDLGFVRPNRKRISR